MIKIDVELLKIILLVVVMFIIITMASLNENYKTFGQQFNEAKKKDKKRKVKKNKNKGVINQQLGPRK
jgi:phosphotransferase system  glucose/maltose/N-acetylglucosamine-specific IIC component